MSRCILVLEVALLASVVLIPFPASSQTVWPPSTTIPAPSWFDLMYWDNLIFGCSDRNWVDDCRYTPPIPNASGHTRVATTEAVQNMNIRIATNADPPLEDVWIDTYRSVIPQLMSELAGGAPWLGSISIGPDPFELHGWIDVVFNEGGCGSGGWWGNGHYQPPFPKPFGTWERGIARLNTVGQGNRPDWCLRTVLLAHELGHVVGLWHVSDPDDIMCTDPVSRTGRCTGLAWRQPDRGQPVFTQKSLRHIQLIRQIVDTYDWGGYTIYPGVILTTVPALPPIASTGLAIILLLLGWIRFRLTRVVRS